MTTELLTRTHAVELELRSDGRTLYGLAVPFDAPTEIVEPGNRYTETFKRGSFARTIAERGASSVKLLAQHDRKSLPIGRATMLREDAAGLVGEFRVSRTSVGDEVLELVNDRALDGLSIGFSPVRDAWTRGRSRVDRLEVKLREVSVVAFPAFAGAQIAGVRSSDSQASRARDRDRLHLILKGTLR